MPPNKNAAAAAADASIAGLHCAVQRVLDIIIRKLKAFTDIMLAQPLSVNEGILPRAHEAAAAVAEQAIAAAADPSSAAAAPALAAVAPGLFHDLSGQMKKKDGDHSVLACGVGGPLISLIPPA